MTAIIYGIPNCDTVRAARRWLDAAGIAYAFHDYRKAGVPEAALAGWVERAGWEALLNRSGTTFRALPAEVKDGIDAAAALRIMVAHPATIRRPVLIDGEAMLIGFSADRYAAQFG